MWGLPSGKLTWLAGKWAELEDVFPIENGNIPASYVSLPECNTSGVSLSLAWLKKNVGRPPPDLAMKANSTGYH